MEIEVADPPPVVQHRAQISDELRGLVIAYLQTGHSSRECSVFARLSMRNVQRIWREFRANGKVHANQRGGKRPHM